MLKLDKMNNENVGDERMENTANSDEFEHDVENLKASLCQALAEVTNEVLAAKANQHHPRERKESGSESDEEESGGENCENLQHTTTPLHELSEEECAFNQRANVLHDYFSDSLTQTEICQKYGMSKNMVWRIVHHKARLDGKAGRPPELSQAAETLMALELKNLTEKGIILHGFEISAYAIALWRVQNPSAKNIPRFGTNWRHGFNRRHPRCFLKADGVRPKDTRKVHASTRSNVNHALQGIKHAIGGAIESWRIITVDETDVSANRTGLGERGFSVGVTKPKQLAPSNTVHTTCVLFLTLDGEVASNSFVIASQSLPADFREANTSLLSGVIVRNKSGSVEITDGSWRTIAEAFVEQYDRKYGTFGVRRKCSYLLFDGCAVHVNDIQTLAWFKTKGIEVIKISPNLTHLIQINDHPMINGKLQGKVRSFKSRVSSLNGGCDLPLERRLHAIDQIVYGLVTLDKVVTAAKSIGFLYEPDFIRVSMTDASISAALDKMELDGAIASSWDQDNGEHENSVELRDATFLKCRSLQNLGVANFVREGVSEELVHALHKYSDQVFLERVGENAPKRPRRVWIRPNTSSSSGTCLLTSEKRLAAGLAKQKAETERKEKQALRKVNQETRRKEQQLVESTKNKRLGELAEHFPGLDLADYRRKLSAYLLGKKTLEEAILVVEKGHSQMNHNSPKMSTKEPLFFEM